MALSRRALLAQATAAATIAATPSVAAAAADTEPTTTTTLRGTIPPGAPDFVYVPVDIPPGVREMRVSYRYDKPPTPPGTPGNALDIGLFDQRGTALGGRGFRGWSGGARSEFFLRTDEATPGYLPGPLEPGRWHIALGPYTVAPQGLPYEITVVLAHSDYHRDPDRIGGTQTVVLADDLSRTAILAGLRAGRAYAAESSAVSLDFTAVGPRGAHAGIGERLRAGDPAAEVLVRLSVTGAEACDLRLVTDQGLAFTAPGATSLEWRTRPARASYVRAEVRHPAQAPPLPGAPAAFTNPIWLDS
ncbi:hypothetical protein M8Z33_07785 [Streptomyces sp. ZAF1911]|uniref:hypothetical protein n=1 Tax=Streptomyces sp. ZAF1911 TaxID=2944129 RepID=UPI00237B28D3|nr:hypothetical protein [Streptomyces sp. ZAF1911]MDD9376576.1 hypothetical protein [Streptomyces sp. ZAF1911]